MPSQSPIIAQDTFTETIVINTLLVLVVLVLFGILKWMFPSFFQPLLINKSNWIVDVANTPLAKIAERGNLAVIFVIIQQMLTYLFLTISFYCITILSPWYFFGTSQKISQQSFWAHLQIISVEDGSCQTVFPIVVCCLLVMEGLTFYSNISVVYVYYKQQVLKRAAPQNFVVMLDNLPPELRNIYSLRKTIAESFPEGLEKIVPVVKNNVKMFWEGWHLERLIRKYQRMKRHVYYWKAELDYSLIQLQINSNFWTRLRSQYCRLFYNIHMRKTLKSKNKARKRRNRIFKIQTQHDIDVDYLRQIDQLQPPFPTVVKSFNFIDDEELDSRNVVQLVGDREKQNQKDEHFMEVSNILDKKQKDDDAYLLSSQANMHQDNVAKISLIQEKNEKNVDKRISRLGKVCFLVFKSQKLASLASRAVLFMDNTAPQLSLAPHPDQILWYNINATKLERISLEFLFWVLIIILFAIFFVPQVILISLFNNSSSEIKIALINLCDIFFDDRNGGSCTTTVDTPKGQVGCWLCNIGTNLIITYLPTLIQAIFMSLLPQCIKILLFIPKYKSRTKRNVSMYICMFIFLILIQGLLDVILGAAISSSGVIQIEQFFNMSVQQALSQMGTNISTQSFSFLNYVLTKYFFFSVLTLLRVPDMLLVMFKLVFFRDIRNKARIYKFPPFNFVLHLSYLSHMTVIGLMYCITSPISSVIILFGLTTLFLVDKYNILYVHQSFPESDMSSEIDVIKVFINNLFIGFILMVCSLFAYCITNWTGWSLYLYSIVLCCCIIFLIIGKYSIDSRYSASTSSLHMGVFEPKGLFSPLLQKFKFNQVSYIKRVSVLYKEYLTVPANPESLEPYDLTPEDINNIACYFTQPGISLANIYPNDENNKEVI